MKTLIFLLITFVITVNGVSQISDALLQTYKNKDLKLRQLSFNGALSGGNSNSEFLYYLNGGANYSQFTNQLNLQSDFSTFFSYENSKTKNTSNSESPIQINNRFQLDAYNKSRYYPRKHFYFGYGYDFTYSLNVSNQYHFINSDKTEKSIDHFGYIRIPLSLGIGRKIPVFSIHKSNWIYLELQKKQCLKRAADEKDIEELAHLIDENVYTRFFDTRYKSIQDLSKVDSLLHSQDLIIEQNIIYFTTLYDMYYYSSGANRFRGRLLEAGFRPQFFYSHYKTTTKSDTTETIFNFELKTLRPLIFVEFQNFKPINQFWQVDYAIRGEYGLKSILKDEQNLTSDFTLKNIEAQAILTHYPNTRTRLVATLAILYGNKYSGANDPYYFAYYSDSFSYYQLSSFPTFILTASQEKESFYSRLSLQHYYYINPQFRLQTSCSFTYSENNPIIDNRNKLIFSFGTSISYALF